MTTDNRGPVIAAVTYIFLFMTTMAVGFRVYTRVLIQKAFGVDDYLCVAAQLFFVTFCTFEIMGVHYGTGQHTKDIDPYNLPIALRDWWACEPLYVLTNMTLKLSIGLFLLRLCVVRVQRYIIYFVIGLTEIYSVVFFFLFVLQCRPASYFWTQHAPIPGTGSCSDPRIVTYTFFGYSAIACLTDWTLAILPIFLVKDLQMNLKTKISVVLLLGICSCASTATIVRIPYLHEMTNTADFLYATSDVAIWSTIETGIGITAAAAATLRPLFQKFFVGFNTTGNSSSNGKSTGWQPPSMYNRTRGYIGTGDRNDVKLHGIATTIACNNDAKNNAFVSTQLGKSDSQDNLKDVKDNKDHKDDSSDRTSSVGSDMFDTTGRLGNGTWGIMKTVEHSQVDTRV